MAQDDTALKTALFNTIVSTLKNQVIATNNLAQNVAALTAMLKTVLPVVQTTSSSATAGSNGAVPAQVFEYLNVTDPAGVAVKVPAFKP